MCHASPISSVPRSGVSWSVEISSRSFFALYVLRISVAGGASTPASCMDRVWIVSVRTPSAVRLLFCRSEMRFGRSCRGLGITSKRTYFVYTYSVRKTKGRAVIITCRVRIQTNKQTNKPKPPTQESRKEVAVQQQANAFHRFSHGYYSSPVTHVPHIPSS